MEKMNGRRLGREAAARAAADDLYLYGGGLRSAQLREYRSSLITAAVTGQIDVETWGKRVEADRRLEKIGEDMTAARPTEQVEARA